MDRKPDVVTEPLARTRAVQDDEIPLSYAQQSLWFMAQLVPDHPFYNLPSALVLRGELDLDALRKTFAALVERHEALRTVFPTRGGRPVQLVQPAQTPEVPRIEVKGASHEARWHQARALASEEGMRPFDLSADPLLRVVVLAVEPDEHVLVFTMHHIASDGWSIAVMSREIPVLYDAYRRGHTPALAPLPMHYRDYARWQRDWLASGKIEPSLAYWREQLAEIEPLRLATDRPRPPIQSHRGATQYIEIPSELRARLEALAHAEGMSLFMVLLALFHVLMGRYSGQDRTLVGTPMANRERHEVEGLIGFFANSMVLACELGGRPSIREVLARVREQTLAAYAHREVPFELLVEHLAIPRDPGRNPLFQVMFSLQKTSVSEIEFPGLEVEALDLDNTTTHFDMEWHLWKRETGLGGYVSYNVDLFEAPTILRLAGHYIRLLELALADPEAIADDIDFLLEPERAWLAARAEPRPHASAAKARRGLVERFGQRATPDAHSGAEPYLVELGPTPRASTLAECLALAATTRQRWAERGLDGGCVLWLASPDSAASCGALAAWSLGMALVPIAVETPPVLISRLAKQRGARFVIASAETFARVPEGLERLEPASAALPSASPTLPAPPADASAICLRIAGRWVQLSHAQLETRCAALAHTYGLGPDTRVASLGLGASASLIELGAALVSGATLVVGRAGPASNDADHVEALLAAELTHLVLTPAQLGVLLDDGPRVPALRRIPTLICTGALPSPELLDTLGPAAGLSPRALYAPPELLAPLGRLRSNSRGALTLEPGPGDEPALTLVDEGGLAVPIGVIGRIAVPAELCVRVEDGPTLADPLDPSRELVVTGERARWQVEAEGGYALELIGPTGSSVWSGGERVDLGACAAAILEHPAVAEVEVDVRRSTTTWELVARVGLQRPTTELALRQACAERLEAHALPAAWQLLARLPRTREGNLARATLDQLPILDASVAARWQDSINAQVGVQQARVLLRELRGVADAHHLTDLVPDWAGRQTPVSDQLVESGAREQPEDRSEWDARPRAYASGGPLELPEDAPQTLSAALLRSAERFPERGLRCLSEAGEVLIPYPELVERARRVLAGLRKAGLGPGERVMLQIEHLPDHFACFWGCVFAGVIPVTVAVPPLYSQRNSVVNKLWNTWKLLEGPWILHSESCGPGLAGVPALFEAEGPPPFAYRQLRAEALLAQAPAETIHPAKPEDVIFYQLTSGSTGLPKCIQETHRGVIHHIHGSAIVNGYEAEDVSLNWLPLDHVVPILTCHLKDSYLGIAQIHVKTALILAEPLRWLELMAEHGVTHTWSPNFGFKLVCDRLAQRDAAPNWDLSRLKFAMNAGEQVTLSVVREWLRRLAPCGVRPEVMQPSFGMAEACTCMTYNNDFRPETGTFWVDKASLGGRLRPAEPGPGAIAFIDLGPVMPGVEIRITDADDQVVPEDVIGRFQIRGQVITPGYLANDEANRAAFVGEGWFNSGDLGFIHDGRLALTGREKEIIIVRGANFYCYEIEDVVGAIEGVIPTFCAAIAVREPETGSETLAVLFVPAAGLEPLDAGLCQRVREVVGRDLGISPGIVVPLAREEFPKTTSGKIQRTRLKRALAGGEYDTRLRQLDLALDNAKVVPAWFFVKRWRPVALPATNRLDTAALDTGATLIFVDGEGLGLALAAALPGPCIRVEPGEGFAARGEDRYVIGPRAAHDYTRLVEALVERDRAPRRIVHLWHYASDSSDPTQRELDTGVASLLLLCQTLERAGLLETRVQLLSVARHSQVLGTEGPATLVPARAAVQALIQTAVQELPKLDARHLDLDAGPPAELAAKLVAELAAPVEDSVVVYRGPRRLIPALHPLALDGAAEPRLRRGAAYVITGGLGGIALHLARHLLTDLDARLLLIGRSELGEDSGRAHQLRELEALGSVAYAAADVSDPEALARALAGPLRSWGQAPEGVFHLAGSFRTAPLVELGLEALADELQAKVAGLEAVRAALPDPCRLFVFGSVNALVGGVTAGAYSVASRFVEAFVEAERAAGIETSHCIGWSMWDEVGMSRGYLMKQASRAQGFWPIAPAKGLVSMRAVLDRQAPLTYVGLDPTKLRVRHLCDTGPLELHELAAWYSTGSTAAPPGLDQLRVHDRFGTPTSCSPTRQTALPLRAEGSIDDQALLRHEGRALLGPIAEPRNSTERMLVSIWREVLGHDAIDVHANFFELGGQSILLVQVHHRLVQVTGRALSVVDLLRYPSVATLAEFLDRAQTRAPSYERAAKRARRQKQALRRRKKRA